MGIRRAPRPIRCSRSIELDRYLALLSFPAEMRGHSVCARIVRGLLSACSVHWHCHSVRAEAVLEQRQCVQFHHTFGALCSGAPLISEAASLQCVEGSFRLVLRTAVAICSGH